MRFRDREDAGRQLGAELARYQLEQPIVLALPRGGVPVGYEVARALGAPLDVLLVRKLGAPFQPELGIGAIAEGGVMVLDRRAAAFGITDEQIAEVRAREEAELARRVRRFRDGRPPPDLRGHTAIVVDDGIATGGTARAALRALRQLGAQRVVLAVPVAPPESLQSLAADADHVVCLQQPEDLWAIGAWYVDFRQLDDEEVVSILDRARRQRRERTDAQGPDSEAEEEPEAGTTQPAPTGGEARVVVPTSGVSLEGDLALPPQARGVVLFAHGSGSSRHSPRNRAVAAALRRAGLGTLLVDLLTPEEEAVDALTAELRFDIDLLAERLVGIIDWLHQGEVTRHLAIGLFGASTGAAAALVAAAQRPDLVAAVVSRGGRPDLAMPVLHLVRAPTLLIVGGADYPVIDMNRDALARLRADNRLVIVPGATHLFEEPGALDDVAALAAEWFTAHLGAPEMHPAP